MKRALLILAAAAAFAQSPEECRAHRSYRRLAEAQACFEKLALSRDPYLKAEGLWGLGMTRDANDQFRAAVAMRPKDAGYRVRWGMFFLDRWQPADAVKLFQEALEIQPDHPRALLGLALRAADDFERKAVELAEAALKADPKLVEARELLAWLALEDANPAKAAEEADKALALSKDALDALAAHAAIALLADKPAGPWLDRIFAVNPHYGEAYARIGKLFVINRRYEEAIGLFNKALEKYPELWSARSELGLTLMRLGRDEEARQNLELCYEANHRDPATVNSLRLMDSYKNFVTYRTPSGILRLHKKEAGLLRVYFEPELERAIRVFEKKYQLKLDKPVQVEVYPDHEDFAVRTMGMPGLGALGVTFGYVVAMDSPSGRRPGTFHWASTLWHELSHVFVLTATRHRVPRWFTEGMAVHEETATSPDWGDRLDPTAIRAIKEKKLLPVAQLDRGFIRPSYPEQVPVSYFQAGRICDYINQKWGYQKLLDMMHAFAKPGAATPEVVERQLGMKPEEFDKLFLAWLDAQVGKTVASFDEWRKRLKLVAEAAKADRHDDVIKEGSAIRDLYPDYVEPGNVYEFLADAYLAKNDKASAMAQLEKYAATGGRYPGALKKLAGLQEEAGRKRDAAHTLSRINFIFPVGDEALHAKLGDLWREVGDRDAAIREYQAALASKPHDLAAAHFRLAEAYRAANRNSDAHDHVILSLEAAPGYRPAQKLLLELTAANTAPSQTRKKK